tara:strand:+ start:362 stop:574 length:213 start_codon:yes stop_codon:yes gene_type:complete
MNIPIEGHKNLYRDPHSKAIINADSDLMKITNHKRKQNERIHTLESSINTLKEDMLEIKSLLKKIAEDNR